MILGLIGEGNIWDFEINGYNQAKIVLAKKNF